MANKLLKEFEERKQVQEDMEIYDLVAEKLGICTYDSDVDKLFIREMMEVIDVILQRTTFDYQESYEKYLIYLRMVHMPFIADRINWGTSIRGAWFEDENVMQEFYDELQDVLVSGDEHGN